MESITLELAILDLQLRLRAIGCDCRWILANDEPPAFDVKLVIPSEESLGEVARVLHAFAPTQSFELITEGMRRSILR